MKGSIIHCKGPSMGPKELAAFKTAIVEGIQKDGFGLIFGDYDFYEVDMPDPYESYTERLEHTIVMYSDGEK